MALITCEEFLENLQPWMEGERSPEAQAHLRDCRHCLSTVNDLNFIRSEARSWDTAEIKIPERIWISLRAELEQEGLIRDSDLVLETVQSMSAPVSTGWFGGIFGRIPRPVFAGAYLAALIAVAFALSGPVHKRVNEARWLEGTRIATSPLSAQLNTAEQNSISYLPNNNSAVSASLHQ